MVNKPRGARYKSLARNTGPEITYIAYIGYRPKEWITILGNPVRDYTTIKKAVTEGVLRRLDNKLLTGNLYNFQPCFTFIELVPEYPVARHTEGERDQNISLGISRQK